MTEEYDLDALIKEAQKAQAAYDNAAEETSRILLGRGIFGDLYDKRLEAERLYSVYQSALLAIGQYCIAHDRVIMERRMP